MLDIDSCLRIPFLLILVLKRGGSMEGKISHDLSQTHTMTQRREHACIGLEISSGAPVNPCGVCTRTGCVLGCFYKPSLFLPLAYK